MPEIRMGVGIMVTYHGHTDEKLIKVTVFVFKDWRRE